MKAFRSKKYQDLIRKTYDELVAEWGVEVEERKVSTRYGETHVLVWGNANGKPLVLFHGVGDDSALMWYYNAKALGERYRLYAVDTIGGPGKTEITAKYDKSFDDVLWIDDLLEGLGLDRVSMAGVSHGGYLVQLYTAKRMDKVDKAIVLASSLAKKGDSSTMSTMMKVFFPEALIPSQKNVIKLLKKLSGDNYMAFTENQKILEHFTYLMKGFNNMAMGYHKVLTLSEDEINIVREKALFFVGIEDPFEKLGGDKMLRDNNMNAKFYENVGHGINHEIADEINNEIIRVMEA